MGNNANIGVTLTGNKTQLDATLDAAKSKLQNFSLSVKQWVEGATINKAVGALTGLLADPFASLQKVFEKGADLEKLRMQTGQSAKDMLILGKAFKMAGLDGDDAGTQVNRLQKALSGVNAEGVPTNKAFEDLGLNITKLRGMTAVQQFDAVGKSLRGIQDPALRSRIAMELFGREGGKMLAMFERPDALGAAAKSLGGQAEIMARNAALFERISVLLAGVGNKVQGVFIGIADYFGPMILPVLEMLNKIDLSSWGQAAGRFVATILQFFENGSIGQILGLSLKAGSMLWLNFLNSAFISSVNLFIELFAQGWKNIVALFRMVTTADFWMGMLNVLAGIATKFAGYLLNALAKPFTALQAGFQVVTEMLRNWLIDAFTGPIAYLKAGIQYALQELLNKLPAAVQKFLGVKQEHKSFDELHADAQKSVPFADAEKTAPDYNQAYKDIESGPGASLFGMSAKQLSAQGDSEMAQGGKDLVPAIDSLMSRMKESMQAYATAAQSGFKVNDLFDTSAVKKQIAALVGTAAKQVEAGKAKADGDTKSGAGGISTQFARSPEKVSSLAKIGGGHYAAVGAQALQREANGLLRKIVANTALKSGPLVLHALQTKPLFAV